MATVNINIKTERLSLRDFKQSDLANVHEYASNEEVVRHQTWGPNTVEQTLEFVSTCVMESSAPRRRTFNLAVVLGEDRVIGGCMAAVGDDTYDAEIGYSFNPAFWGRGYASEAVSALTTFLFEKMDVQRIYATCGPQNIGSIRLLTNLGFRLDGRLRAHKLVRGERRDSLIWSRLREDRLEHGSSPDQRLLQYLSTHPALALLTDLTPCEDKTGHDLLRSVFPIVCGPVAVNFQHLAHSLGSNWRATVVGWQALANALIQTTPHAQKEVISLTCLGASAAALPEDTFSKQTAIALFGSSSELDLTVGILALGPRVAAGRLSWVAKAVEQMQLVS